MTSQGVVIGFTRKGELVRVPVASWRAVISLLLGATGSGKTILQVLLALAAIKRGFGVIYIDPKGDDFVLEELRAAAARAGRPFRPWDPQGKIIYNPYDRGTNTEIADKLLAAEVFTEPHYQRLAQPTSVTSSERCDLPACRSASRPWSSTFTADAWRP